MPIVIVSGGRSTAAGRSSVLGGGEDPGAVVGDGDGVLPVGGTGAVAGDDGPAVVELLGLVGAQGEHGLDGDGHAGLQAGALAGLAEVGQEGLHVHLGADAVAAVVGDDAVLDPIGLVGAHDGALDGEGDVGQPGADDGGLDAGEHGGASGLGEFAVGIGAGPDEHGHGGVAVPAVEDCPAVDGDQVT